MKVNDDFSRVIMNCNSKFQENLRPISHGLIPVPWSIAKIYEASLECPTLESIKFSHVLYKGNTCSQSNMLVFNDVILLQMLIMLSAIIFKKKTRTNTPRKRTLFLHLECHVMMLMHCVKLELMNIRY